MLVLALDTALQRCSVSILRDDDVVGHRSIEMARGHAEHLAPMVAELLVETGVAIADLDRVGVVIGPGGFAGVRVGLAFARGLVLGSGIALIGVTSLAALAAGVTSGDAVMAAPIIDARRGQVYAALYDSAGNVAIEPFVSEPEKALNKLEDSAGSAEICLLGSGAELIAVQGPDWAIVAGHEQVDINRVARMAAAANLSPVPVAPLYLRPPDAKPAAPVVDLRF